MTRASTTLAGLLIGSGATLLVSPQALAQTGEPFFKGRTISIISGFTPGGSYDFYSRLVSRHLGRHIPGQPTIVIQTMPGAGGLNAANHLFNVAPKDGTAIGILSQTLAVEEALGAPRLQYKAAEFNWLGRVSTSVEVTVTWSTSKVRTIADARTHQVLLASSGPGSALDSYPRVLAHAAGLNFKIVSGYKGSSEALLAMEKGEVDGTGTTWNTLKINRRNWLDENRINILVQYSRTRAADLQAVPAAAELGRSADEKALLDFYMRGAEIGRSFVAPPGLDRQRLVELRRAFDAAMKAPELIGEIRRANAEFAPLSGTELHRIVDETLAVKPELAAQVRQVLQGAR